MKVQRSFVGVLVALLVAVLSTTTFGQTAAQPASTAAAAVKANPQFITSFAKDIGSTPEQAAGAAGTLFSLAKSRLKADEFATLAKAIPGMDALLGAAPAAGASSGTTAALGQLAGGLGPALEGFKKLGLSPDMIAKAAPALIALVTKSGGADVGKLLAGVLK